MAETLVSSPCSSGNTFAIMSIHKRDKLRFLQFPEEIYTAAENIINTSWPPGLQEQKMYGQSYEYKLKGSPWGSIGEQEGVGSRVLMRNLLAFLYRRGWVLVTPLSHSIRVGTKDSLIFKKEKDSVSKLPLQPVAWLVIAPTHTKRLRIIGDEPDIVKGLRTAFESMDIFQSGDWSFDSFEFKFKYGAWSAHGEATVKTRLLLLKIIEILDSYGWRSYCTCRQRTESDDVKRPDSWYFIKDKKESTECE